MKTSRIVVLLLAVVVIASHADESISTLTVEGETYSGVTFGTVTPATVKIYHSKGVATLPLAKFPPSLQKRFGYDPQRAASYQQAEQVQRQKLDAENAAQEQAKKRAQSALRTGAGGLSQDASSMTQIPITEERVLLEIDGHVYDFTQTLRDERAFNDWNAKQMHEPSRPGAAHWRQGGQGMQEDFTGLGGGDVHERQGLQAGFQGAPRGDVTMNEHEIAQYNADVAKYKADMKQYTVDMAEYKKWQAERSRREQKANRIQALVLTGTITQVTEDGLLVHGNKDFIFLKNYPKADTVVDGDTISTIAVRKGRHSYTSVSGARKTVPLYISARRVDPDQNQLPVEKPPLVDVYESN